MQNERTPHALVQRPVLLAAITFAVVTVAGCGEADPLRPGSTSTASPSGAMVPALSAGEAGTQRGLATFRHTTARYHDVDAALEDGFVQILPCIESPSGDGGIGIPYGRLDRFDATIDLSKPEILFYEPQSDGRLRLIGGEPVVPIEDWTEDEPPSLFGHEFHRNEEHGLYGLHMWIWKHNPDGVFSFWHPDVSCEHA